LQQRGAFPGWAGLAVAAVRGGGFGEAGLVGVECVEGEVAGVRGWDERDLLVAGGDRPGVGLPVRAGDQAGSAEAEDAGVAGVVQDPQDRGVGQRRPVQFSLVRAFAVPAGEQQPGVAEFFDDGVRGSGGVEGGE